MLRVCAYTLLALSLGASAPQSPDVPVSGSGSVYLMVTSTPRKYALNVPRGGPIGFSAVALGGDLKKHTEFLKKTTPYVINLRGSEAYVMLRQDSGEDIMFVEVRVAPHASCEVTSRATFMIVRGSKCGGNFLP